MELIPNYSLSGYTNDGNSVLVTRTDSTMKLNRDGVYSRKKAAFQAGSGVYSVPTNSVVFRRDVGDENGNPVGQRASVTIEFRTPVAFNEADLDALLLDARAYLNSTTLKAELTRQDLPTCCAPEEGA